MKHLIGRFWLPGVLSCLYGLGFLLQENQSHDPASDKRAMIEASLESSQSKAWQSIAGAAESVKAVPALPVPPEFGVTDLAVLAESASTQEKKRRFFALLQPLIRQENHYILQQRAWLKQLDVQNLVEQERTLLRQLATEYKVKAEDDRARYQELMVRVDSIPLELVLAQAANESAWGSSRFAREGNNLFGQWCFTPGCGLVPARRSDGEHHEVAKFVSAQQSVRAYLHNLNTFKAYRELRQLRAQLRHKQEAVSGMVLVEGLQRYSQRGMDYVRDLQSMMRVNQPLVAQVARQVLSSY